MKEFTYHRSEPDGCEDVCVVTFGSNSMSLMVIHLFRFSIPIQVNFGNLYFVRNYSFYLFFKLIVIIY